MLDNLDIINNYMKERNYQTYSRRNTKLSGTLFIKGIEFRIKILPLK